MNPVEKLLLQNKAWAHDCVQRDCAFFERTAHSQSPSFLWIGCSDSRVPANEVTGTAPGEIFVHRNVANLVVPGDVNAFSVIQYAVDVLQVKHVIVCGHYGCGGVLAAMGDKPLGLIDNWLGHIKEVYAERRSELAALPEPARADRLVELNVEAQVDRLAQSEIIRAAWQKAPDLVLHGWVYGLGDGILKPLRAIGAEGPVTL